MARFDSMQIFTTVVRTNNFTNAAQLLGLTPSAISKQISLLEKRLGVKLLERTTRSVHTTEAGQAYFERCSKILHDLEEAEHYLTHYQNETSGKLKLAITPSIGRELIADVIQAFSNKHPNIYFDLTLDYFNADKVKGQFDIAIQLGKSTDASLQCESICRQKVTLYAAKSYLTKFGTPLHLHEVKSHQLVIAKEIDFTEPRWIKGFLKQSQLNEVTPNVAVNDLDLSKQLCLQGQGIAALPDLMMKTEFESGEVRQVLPEIKFPARAISCIYPANRYLSNRSRVFIDFLKEFLN